MKKLMIAILLSVFGWGEYYKVEISRIESNLYKTNSGVYIKTRWCYEYATYEEAIIKYEDYSYDNKIIFDSGEQCDIEKLMS